MRKEHAPPFFAPISGPARNGKQGRCAHTCYFAWPGAPQKCLLGSSPNPPDFWTLCPEVLLSAAPRRYRSWALFRSSVWPSRQSMFPLTATASRISAWALRYSA